jgi:hypothetical protein
MDFSNEELETLIHALASSGITTVAVDRLYNRLQDELDVRALETREESLRHW